MITANEVASAVGGLNKRARQPIPEALKRNPPLYIFNIYEMKHTRGLGSLGTFHVPACEPGEAYSKPLVVIADDDPIIHSLLAPMLAKLGVDTFSVRDGQEALDTVLRLSPDVLVLDIGMPKMNGISVLREIRKLRKNQTLQILMLSVRQQQNDIGMAFAYGANDYAVKPFDPENVTTRIMRLVRHLTASLSHES